MGGDPKKERYPLEAVLSLRRLERDERVQDLGAALERDARCRRGLEEARLVERRARNVLDDAIRERRRRERRGMRAADLQAHVRRQEALEKTLARRIQALDEARDASRRASRELEEARERLALARSEMRAIEKHRNDWQEERRREEERRSEEDP